MECELYKNCETAFRLGRQGRTDIIKYYCLTHAEACQRVKLKSYGLGLSNNILPTGDIIYDVDFITVPDKQKSAVFENY